MSQNRIQEESVLRFAAPKLYRCMVDTFSSYNIHPYDVQGTLSNSGDGYDVTLRFSSSFSQAVTTHFSYDQATEPDENVTLFFKETAEQCRKRLISDYFKMIKL